MFPAAERQGRQSAIDDNLRTIDDVKAAGYRGFHEVEIFSARNWWKREPDDVLGVVKRRHQECC